MIQNPIFLIAANKEGGQVRMPHYQIVKKFLEAGKAAISLNRIIKECQEVYVNEQ
jgi:hypothetical protein